MKGPRVIITGGGTGGHIFPALSIGSAIKKRAPEAEILFVGAQGGMEMELVPKHGFRIEGVRITGIARRMTLGNIIKNMAFPFKLWSSIRHSKAIVKRFRPDVVVGVGGYASGPVGRAASGRGIPLVLCEQNAYPGMTNKWLAGRAARILLGNAAAEKYFDKSKTRYTGNPVRPTITEGNRQLGLEKFGLDGSKPVVLSLGGSLGAGTINQALLQNLNTFIENDIQLVWQCGKRYYDDLKTQVMQHPLIHLMPFIDDMPNAYAAADLVISRAGGSTISELILLNQPSVMVPSPNVAEDHQTKNAMSLVDAGAAKMVKDVEANEKLVSETVALLNNEGALSEMRKNLEAMEKYNAAEVIADEIFALLKR